LICPALSLSASSNWSNAHDLKFAHEINFTEGLFISSSLFHGVTTTLSFIWHIVDSILEI
jgi:hypothetical protein